MEFIKYKKLTLLILISTIYTINTHAQYIGISAAINHNSNGINVFYTKYFSNNERTGMDIGLRVAVNTFAVSNNYENYVYYQTGYANEFKEYFGIYLRGYTRLFQYKKFRVDAHINIFSNYNSLLKNFYGYDINRNIIYHTIIYWKPAFTIECTIGLQFQYKISNRFSLQYAVGVGYAYYDHRWNEGWDKTENHPVIWILSANKKHNLPGEFTFTGLDGIPSMSLGIKYNLKK